MSAESRAEKLLHVFQQIPLGIRKAFFVRLALLAYAADSRHRLITLHNLRMAFPEKPDDELGRIARGVYRNLGIVAAEFFDLPKIGRENLADWVELEGIEHAFRALEKNRGLLLFGAHFGNWELEAITAALVIKPMMVIYRLMDSPTLEILVSKVRSCTGNILQDKDRAMRPMLRILKQNGIIGLLLDQNVAWQEGVFVDFFGRTACTSDGLALLALHTEAPVLPGYMARLENGKYRFVLGEEVPLARTGNRKEDVLENTQRFTSIIEDTVRKYPDQWFWVHQRWKTKPWQAPRRT